jgi:type VI protein secretion system component VasK
LFGDFCVSCLIQLLFCLGLISIGRAVLVGQLKVSEALQRIGALFLVLLLAPAVLAVLVKGVVVPAATVIWPAAKYLVVVAALILGLLLIAWVVAGVFERYRNRNSGEHNVHSERSSRNDSAENKGKDNDSIKRLRALGL